MAKAVQQITQYYPDPPVSGTIPNSPPCSVAGVPPPGPPPPPLPGPR